MIWSGREVSNFIKNIGKKNIQPCGVDLTVGNLYSFSSIGELRKGGVKLPEYTELESINNLWTLSQGSYIVRYEQIIEIPPNAVGLVLPRSSLLRMGATIYTAVWDPGYRGKGVSLLQVFNSHGIILEKGARISQLIFLKAEAKETYSGKYQNEGLD